MKGSLLFSLIIGAVAVALYLFGVEPAETKLKRIKAELVDAQTRQDTMARNLKSADLTDKRLASCRESLSPFKEAMLVPLLESYAMRAKSLVDPLATGAGLANTEYEELPRIALPVPKRLPKQLHARKPIRLTASGSYQAAVSFLARLEREFPLVALQSFALTAGNNPQAQRIEMILEWPVTGAKTVVEKGPKK